jgi:hypothetical protein
MRNMIKRSHVVAALTLILAVSLLWKPVLTQAGFQFDSSGNLLIKLNAGGSGVDGSNNAKVVGVGTAGTASGGVLTVQGVASMTPVLATVSQATAANLNATVVGTGTFAVQSTLQAGTSYVGKVATFADGTLASGAVTTAMTSTTSTSVIGGTASNYVYVTQCTTSNGSTTVSTDILLQDGSGGTTLYVLPAPAAATATTGGGGGAFSFSVPLKVPTSGNGLFAANVTTGSSTKISCSGFKSTTSF